VEGREGKVASSGGCVGAGKRARAKVDTIPWIDALPPDPTAVLRHLYREMGRLGIELDDLSPTQRSVLQDVEHWIDRGLVDALTHILSQIAQISSPGRDPQRAPIQVRAVITRRGALSLRWGAAVRSKSGEGEDRPFRRRAHLRVVGAEGTSPNLPDAARRSVKAFNGVLLLRSVRGLSESSRSTKANNYLDPVSILLIFLVRRCYENFIERLRERSPVEMVDRFIFAFDRTTSKPFQQLRSWKIVEAQDRVDNLVALEGARGRARR